MPVTKRADFEKVFQAKMNKISAETRAATRAAAEIGAETMKQHISTRATAKGGRRPEHPGRVDTGAMLNAVSVRSSGNQYFSKSAFGWLSSKQDYFGHQEFGFNHRSAGAVPGMYALTDAFEEVTNELWHDIEGIVKSV